MTPEQALKVFKAQDHKRYGIEYEEASNMGLTALRKLIPVRPLKDYMGGEWHYVCGACGADMVRQDKFCHECGKAVKWE